MYLIELSQTDVRYQIAERLRDCRYYSGMTNKEIAQRVDVSEQTASGWSSKNDPHLPDVITLRKLADLFGKKLDELVP